MARISQKTRTLTEGATRENTELLAYNKRGKLSLSMYDCFILVIILANLINPNEVSWWLMLACIFWERPYVIMSDIIENSSIYLHNKRIEKKIKEEINESNSK